ncbi:MAG: PAS domain-containing sensor histidine kinase [Bacteroidetes bacterium]|nr:PAS domain-containing sensor histidine kinase [Bacteroidota bacterium]
MSKSANWTSLLLAFSIDGYLEFNFSSNDQLLDLVTIDTDKKQNFREIFKEPLLSRIKTAWNTLSTTEPVVSFNFSFESKDYNITLQYGTISTKGILVTIEFNAQSHDKPYSAEEVNPLPKFEDPFFNFLINSVNTSLFFVEYTENGFIYRKINAAYTEQTGVQAHELIGKSAVDVDPKLGVLIEERFKKVIDSKESVDYLISRPYKKEIKYWQSRLTPLFCKDGTKFLVGSAFEVSKEHSYMKALENEQHLLRMLMDYSLDDIYFKDKESRFIRVNRATATKLGLNSPDEAIGKTDFDFFDPTVANRTLLDEKEKLNTGKPLISKDEMGIFCQDTSHIIWGSTSKFPIKNLNGEITGIIGITRDISEKKRSDLALQESEQKFRLLADNIIDLVITTKADGTITYVSPSVSKLLEREVESILNKNIFTLIHPEDYQRIVSPAIENLTQSNKVEMFEYRIAHKNGDYIWFSTHAKQLKNQQSDELEILSVSRDSTIQHDLLEKLKETNQQKDKLFSVLSHDLRSPISASMSLSNMLLEDYDSYNRDEVIEFLKMIQISTEKLHFLMDELLTWSRTQLNKVSVHFEHISITSIVDSVSHSLTVQLQHKSISLLSKLETTNSIFTDAQLVISILRNLISNSIKYSSKNSTIELHIKEKNNHFQFDIVDYGLGMRESQVQQLLYSNAF